MRSLLALLLLALLAPTLPAVVNTVTTTLDETYTVGSTLGVLTLTGGIDKIVVTLDSANQSQPTLELRTEGDIIRSSTDSTLTTHTKMYAAEVWRQVVNRRTLTIYIQGTAGQKVWTEIRAYPNH